MQMFSSMMNVKIVLLISFFVTSNTISINNYSHSAIGPKLNLSVKAVETMSSWLSDRLVGDILVVHRNDYKQTLETQKLNDKISLDGGIFSSNTLTDFTSFLEEGSALHELAKKNHDCHCTFEYDSKLEKAKKEGEDETGKAKKEEEAENAKKKEEAEKAKKKEEAEKAKKKEAEKAKFKEEDVETVGTTEAPKYNNSINNLELPSPLLSETQRFR